MNHKLKTVLFYLGMLAALFAVDIVLAHIFRQWVNSEWFYILSGLCDIIVVGGFLYFRFKD